MFYSEQLSRSAGVRSRQLVRFLNGPRQDHALLAGPGIHPRQQQRRHLLAVIITDADKDYVDLTIGTPDGPKTVQVTAHHSFYSATAGLWVNAADLEEGNLLATPGNGRSSIIAVRHYRAEVRTYDLTVQAVQTYYVLAGHMPVLVHNNNGPCGVWQSKFDNLPKGKARARSGDA
ncbi:Hint domain-containing protein [Actinosynnema sp. CA-248983]